MNAARSARSIGAPLTALLLAALAAGAADAQRTARDAADCGVCHGELELLRQHVATPARARELVVTREQMRGSGHDAMACAECHRGYSTFPHPAAGTVTASCASCHAAADTAWAAGQHALRNAAGETGAPCTACHGTHAVATAAALERAAPRERMNATCVACHSEAALPASDPHAGEVGCWSCHAAHAVHAVDDPAAAVAPARQAATCGACHDTAAADWHGDAHGGAMQERLAAGGPPPGLPATPETPVCTACHGGHGVLAAEHPNFAAASVARCAECHEHHARTFFGTYHGKATALGSRIAATCADCHGAHRVFAQDDARSTVHTAQLIETCAACHPNARPAFVKYDSHPELGNWRRNPVLTASFVFMNGLLVFVLTVFGLHTLLWWIRLRIDRRRGIHHGPGHHPPPDTDEAAERGIEP